MTEAETGTDVDVDTRRRATRVGPPGGLTVESAATRAVGGAGRRRAGEQFRRRLIRCRRGTLIE